MRSGLPVDEALVVRASSRPDGRREALRLLAAGTAHRDRAGNDNRPSACCRPSRAWPAPPDDISVVGFDDVIAAWATPPMTAIRQPLAAMTAAGFRMLRMGGEGSVVQPSTSSWPPAWSCARAPRPPRD